MVRLCRHGIGLFTAFCLAAQVSTAEDSPRTVRTANFIIDAPSTELAELIGKRAEVLRREIALTWLGTELPQSEHVNLIYVEIDDQRSTARTMVSPTNRGHFVSLVGSFDEVTDNLLAHEVAHTVFAARYGTDMPAWANEGIASLYDDAQRCEIRAQWLRDFVHERLWPDLIKLMEEPIRCQSSYTAASSVTAFLLELGTRQQFMTFMEDGRRRGWDAALASHYSISGQAHLAEAWQRWVTSQVTDGGRDALANVPSRTTFVAHRQSDATRLGL